MLLVAISILILLGLALVLVFGLPQNNNVSTQTKVRPQKSEILLEMLLANTMPIWNVPRDHLLIGSAHCTDFRFIEAQFQSLKAFVKVPFTYFVINDTKKYERMDRYEAIVNVCNKNNIKHIEFPQELHDHREVLFPNSNQNHDPNGPSVRASNVVQFMLQIFKMHQGYALMLDSDCVVINPLIPSSVLFPNFTYAGPPQTRWSEKRQKNLDYVWIVVILFDMLHFPAQHLMNLDCGFIDGVRMDTGGMWNNYIEETNNIPKYFIENNSQEEIAKIKVKFPRVECFDNLFLHFHNGSQWENISDQQHSQLVEGWLTALRELIVSRT
jgi:hypothetical protein